MKLEDHRFWLAAAVKECRRRANKIVADYSIYDKSPRATELVRRAEAVLDALKGL